MKRKILITLMAFVSFCVCFYFYNNNSSFIVPKFKRMGASSLDKLTYRVYFLGVFPVAQAEINFGKREEYQGKQVYHLSARAESLKIISNVFNASAVSESYVNVQDYNPLLFRQKISIQGKPDDIKEALYDQKNGIMTIRNVRRDIPPNTQDALSAIFNLRRMDFKQTKDFQIILNTNQKNYILEGLAQQKNGLVFLKGDIRRKDKNPYHRSQISMVLLPEKENLPVLIKVFASGVLITVKLTDIK